LTGEFEIKGKDECSDLIHQYGGRVTSAVSKQTNYLVTGENPGPSKLATAKSLKIKIMTEGELLEMVDDLVSKMPKGEDNENLDESPVSPVVLENPHPKPAKLAKSIPADENPYPKPPKVSSASDNPYPKPPKMSASGNPYPPKKSVEDTASLPVVGSQDGHTSDLWVDMFKPSGLNDIIGNNANVKKLVEFLDTWKSDSKLKAALLSGPPGIGKTTSALLVSRLSGYEVIEFNASDTRNQKTLRERVADLLDNRSINEFQINSSSKKSKDHHVKQVLLMDEVDGMSSGDRGGMPQLVKLIQSSKVRILYQHLCL
jgi:replication factor C subunit 1